MSVNLHKFDLKGNLIMEWLGLIADVTAQMSAAGIETDGDRLWISSTDTGVYYIKEFTKKATLIKGFSPSNSYGITTNGKDLILSQVGSVNMVVMNKSGTIVRTTAAATAKSALSFNGTDILAVRAGFAIYDILDQRTFALKKAVTVASAPNGICSVHKHVALIVGPATLVFQDYSGNIIKSITLPNPLTVTYVDLCHDRDFLWIISTSANDIDPLDE